MKKMIIISPWLGLVNRGAETFARELAVRLSSSFHITLVTGGDVNVRGVFETIICNDFITPIHLKLIKHIYDMLSAYSHKRFGFLFKVILKIWDRIYYVHPEPLYQKAFMRHLDRKVKGRMWDYVFPQNGMYGAKWASRQREIHNSKFIYTGHGGVGRSEKMVLDFKPDLYVAISEGAKHWAMKYCDRVELIYNGFNAGMFRDVNRKSESTSINVLSVGALTSFKRHALTINALSLIPNAYLMIVGHGELKYELEKLADIKMPGRYKIKSVPYDKMPELYKDADIFVLPSKNEPMGIVYIEALSSGVKVVAPDDAVRREILGAYGYYADVESAFEYAKAIKVAYSASYARDAAIEYCCKKYSWDYIAEKYVVSICNA